jgi:hypothetical protein
MSRRFWLGVLRVVPPADDVGFLRRVIGDVVAVNRVNRGRVWLDPTDAFELDAVRGLVRLQLLTLRLGPEPDVAERRSDAFDLRFDNAIGQARASEMHFVLLEDVPHEYPNDPNGFSMPDVLWRFFRGRPAL